MISSSEVVAIPFYQDELALLVPNDHPFASQKEIPLSALNDMPFLHREQGSALRQYLDEYFKKKPYTRRYPLAKQKYTRHHPRSRKWSRNYNSPKKHVYQRN